MQEDVWKGLAASDTIGILLVILTTVFFLVYILPTLFSTIIETLAKSSPENVARQVSSLISSSATSTFESRIEYFPGKDKEYKIEIFDRIVKVGIKSKLSYAEKTQSKKPILIDLYYRGDDVNTFIISKKFVGVSSYAFEATKK